MQKKRIDFTGKFGITTVLSLALVIGSLGLIGVKGINYGVDFRGGSEIQVKFGSAISATEIRAALGESGVKASSVQSLGEPGTNEFLIKIAASDKDINQVTNTVVAAVNNGLKDKAPEIRKTDIVGPRAGQELKVSGLYAMIWALLAILVYIGLRFDVKYAPGAIVALFHDVVIIVGCFSLIQKEFSLQIVGALLAVIGYSVNDTVVIYDRVREHENRGGKSILGHINEALNETLTRTILTSLTTLFVALTMFFMGGGVIHDFFFAISLGVLIGTYSSVFVAAPTVVLMDRLVKNKQSGKATA